jgi:hypothetical protein
MSVDPEIFEKAAEILEQKGWCQEEYEDLTGRLCFVGALRWAMFGTAGLPSLGLSNQEWEPHRLVLVHAEAVLGEDPTGWNDVPWRTAAEVIDTMKVIAKDLRNKAQPT